MVGPSFGSQCRPTKSFGSRECRPTKSIFLSENWKLRCMLFHLVEHCILFASPAKNNSFAFSKWSKIQHKGFQKMLSFVVSLVEHCIFFRFSNKKQFICFIKVVKGLLPSFWSFCIFFCFEIQNET